MRLELGTQDRNIRGLFSRWGRLLRSVIGEKSLWVVLGFGLVLLAVAYSSPRALFVDIGGPFDGPQTPGFFAPESNNSGTFRWSTGSSALSFAGIGKPLTAFTIDAQLASGRATGASPITVNVLVNGHASPPLVLTAESKLYKIVVDPSWIGVDGDVTLNFQAPTFQARGDKRDLAFIADFARVNLPQGITLPALPQLVYLLLSAALLYALGRACWLTRRASAAVIAALLVLASLVIVAQRLFITVFTDRILVTVVLAWLLALLLEPVARWLARSGGWRGERAVPEWAWAGLRGLVVLAVLLKVGGLLYPHTVIVDAYFHLKQTTYMAEGRPWEQFFGKNLALSVMPKDEWGDARAFIPYSPFFYVIAAPLLSLPFPKELSVPTAAALLEAVKVALVFLLALALGGRRRPGVLALAAAATYSFIPATFLLQQWGNWPTQISFWLVTLWATVTCLLWRRYTSPSVWIISTLILTLTMLSYTVTAAYMAVLGGLLVVAGAIFAPDKKRWSALILSLAVAAVAAVLIFYGQYIGLILRDTLPTFGKAVQEQGKLTTLRPTLDMFLTNNLGRAMQSYNVAIPFAIAFAGALVIFVGRAPGRNRVSPRFGIVHAVGSAPARTRSKGKWRVVWMGVWLLAFPLFAALDFYVDQVFKEFWFVLPPVAIAAGVFLYRLWRRGATSPVYSAMFGLLCTALVWQSLSLWVFRLLFHNR